MKLLVVDDNKDITEMVRFYCESKDLDCTLVNDGISGLEIIHNNNEFDLILLDLEMPEVSGLDVIKSLKKENLLKQNNVVVFTASSDPILLEEIKMSGVTEILQKPCSIDKLGEVIGKYGSS